MPSEPPKLVNIRKDYDAFRQVITLRGGYPPIEVSRTFTVADVLANFDHFEAWYADLRADMEREYAEKYRRRFLHAAPGHICDSHRGHNAAECGGHQ